MGAQGAFKTAENGGFRPGQEIIRKIVPAPFYNEDPHVYRNRRGEFHMLAHSLSAPPRGG